MTMVRIYGTEMEWAISESNDLGAAINLEYEEISPVLHAGLVDIPHVKDYLCNGARMYIDVGAHLEYAGPEDDSPLGATANEIASEDLTSRVLAKGFASLGVDTKGIAIHKRVIDDEKNTCGYHENYNALC